MVGAERLLVATALLLVGGVVDTPAAAASGGSQLMPASHALYPYHFHLQSR